MSKGYVDCYDKGHNKDSQPQDILTSQSHMQRGSKGNQIRTEENGVTPIKRP